MTNKKRAILLLIVPTSLFILLLAIVLLLSRYDIQITPKDPQSLPALTEKQAREIAEAYCIKGGEAVSAGVYNQISRTWWFDANLNSTREGCSPACVVSEETKTAEINWRCTGLVDNARCGIENCHGLEIVCGSNPVQMCTMIYQLGDVCRQFASCKVLDGRCQQVENPKFIACKACAQKCQTDFARDPSAALNCESRCGE